MAHQKAWEHIGQLPEVPKTVDLTRVLVQARASGILNVSNRGIGPVLPETISRLHENTVEDERVWENVDLRSLDMSLNAIVELPIDIGNPDTGFPFLTKLICRNNLLSELPSSLGQLSQLVLLDVSHNQLQSLPPSLGQLQALVEFKCENNQLMRFPFEMCSLPRLATLNLDDNALQLLPDELKELHNLSTFTCARNHLVSIPMGVGCLQTLSSLILSHNHIKQLPLLHCPKLRVLDLRENALKDVLDFSRLTSLQQLFISFNPLSSTMIQFFDHSFSQGMDISTVTELHMSNAGLLSLCEDIGLLVNLHALDVSNNELTDLPPCLGYLNKLVRILVEGNAIKRIRRTLIEGETSELKKYLRTRGGPHPHLATIASYVPSDASSGRSGRRQPIGQHVDVYTEDDTIEGNLKFLLRDAASTHVLKMSVQEKDARSSASRESRYSPRACTNTDVHALKSPGDLLKVLEKLDTYMSRPDSLNELHNQGAMQTGQGIHRHSNIFAMSEEVVLPACKCLTKLDVSYNRLNSVLPFQLGEKCLKLREIDVSHNNLVGLWDHTLLPFQYLVTLLASHNLLSSRALQHSFVRFSSSNITGNVIACSSIKHLDLRNNKVDSLPPALFGLIHLHTLLLGNNCLASSLVEVEDRSWCMLKSLETVDFSNNEIDQLGSFPLSSKAMMRLKSIDLSNNALRFIPPEFGLLTCLNALLIHGNPQRGIRQNIIDMGTPSVLDALKNKLPEPINISSGISDGEQRLYVPPSERTSGRQVVMSALPSSPHPPPSFGLVAAKNPINEHAPYQTPQQHHHQSQQHHPSSQHHFHHQQQHQRPYPQHSQVITSQHVNTHQVHLKCLTCGGRDRLEPDVDNPGDIYCFRCWNEWSGCK